jgi:hypothetical protein
LCAEIEEEKMKSLGFLVVAAIALTSLAAPASAGTNDSPHAQACMAKNGFTLEMWRAHRAGTDQQVQSYIQCRDGVSASKALATGRKSDNYSKSY